MLALGVLSTAVDALLAPSLLRKPAATARVPAQDTSTRPVQHVQDVSHRAKVHWLHNTSTWSAAGASFVLLVAVRRARSGRTREAELPLVLPAAPYFRYPQRCVTRTTRVQACADGGKNARGEDTRDSGEDSHELYAGLRQRQAKLAAQRASAEKERELVKELAAEWPHYQRAQLTLFEHWCAEEGVATTLVHATRGGDIALLALIEVYPDWAEPVNQLATLRYMEGKYDESMQLCRRVLEMKPWHFGALGGMVMCHERLGHVEEVERCKAEAMPPPGQRDAWVERMVSVLDDRISFLSVVDHVQE